jgi:hypothetical protein
MFRSSRQDPTQEKAGGRMPIRLGAALVAATGLLLGPLALAASAAATPHATTPVMGTYVPVAPFRITDTRPNSGQPNAGKTLAAAATLNVQVTGLGTVPAGASAAVLNVTAVDPTVAGFLTVFPAGIAMPTVSNLNFTPGVIVANLVTVPLSTAGMVSIFNHAGNTNVVVDVDGYYTSTPSTNGTGLYNSMSPVRALGNLQLGAPVAANTSVPVTVNGAITGVPASATAVVVNVTAAHGTSASYLTVYPAGAATVPTASSVNFIAGQAIANRVTVGVGTNGQIEVYNHTGTVNVDVDVDGYYSGVGGTGSAFVPITPVRITDTRGTTPLNGTPIAANTSESFNLATTLSTVPGTATSVAANVTAVAGNARGYLTVYPTSAAAHPVASDVNWVAKEIVPNFTIADTAGTGSVEVYNAAGAAVNLLIDVFGYFATTSNGPIMESAVVSSSSIAITYNEDVSCVTAVDASFGYFWTGSASGGLITGAACTASSDVLTLTAAGGFTLPGSTGGTIIYTAPVAPAGVYATGPVYAATQTLGVPGAVAPKMVSAYVTGTTIAITYNEDVICPAAAAGTLFTYVWTGIATDTINGCTAGGAGSDLLTLTSSGSINPPGTGASLTYTAPAGGNTPTTALYATGSNPDLYAATQTLPFTAFTTPAITAATVNAVAGTIAVSYSELPMGCPANPAVQAVFKYSNGGTPAYPSTCATSGTGVTLGAFMNATTGTTAEALALPGATDNLVYTSPATPLATNTVYATLDFPQFPAAQTFALTATPAPAMALPVVVTATTVAITYTEGVACPATGADGDFVYDSAFNTLGGAITSCSAVGDVLTLGGIFNTPSGAASIVYTAPATSTTANAVYAAGTTSVFAATQTLFPL